MAQLRIALAQVNPTTGDLDGNLSLVVDSARRAAEEGAHLVVLPEMVVTGYPVEDLALRNSFVSASIKATRALAADLAREGLGELPVVVGYLSRREGPGARYGQPAGAPQNSVAVLHRGGVVLSSAKHHLPNYGVFDEFRNFVPGDTLSVVRVRGVDVALAVCEDLWQEGGPVTAARAAGVGLLVSLNGSPYERHKDDVRLELCQRRAREVGAALAYVNMVGGQDELVFEGDSLIVDSEGELVARAPQFAETLLVADLDLPEAGPAPDGPGARVDGLRVMRHTVSADPVAPYPPRAATVTPRPDPLSDTGEVYRALVTGLRDYTVKNGFGSVLVGVSGGIDSALVATIAVDALGADRVHGVLMPSAHSSDHSVGDAEELARRQGFATRTIAIAPAVEAFTRSTGEAGVPLTGLAAENLQARVRGTLLMALSNEEGHLVLATGNKSEAATGYSTLYGDSVGGFAPIKDCWKTLVWELARWRNEEAVRLGQTPPIPENSISKPPSAELRPDQLDTDSLPDYTQLDAVLDAYVGTDKGEAELVFAGYDPELVRRVIRMVDRAEYKRRQSAPGTKISARNLSRDRRVPITNRWTV
ncbi:MULTISPECIES: NAD+ synthase [Nocardiopsis]|uniref:Glutamine-dependent NAD(+) synthetase n=1 Tax=Nocardiopsis dassonvillei (strain ATCC 23218 / DSM 43111 / CIP 107115 / JCM 7437 / KCTC 9190 / NBRC 14626 / NCTC 10488 / NRRL B-5397 / IMRU 509) TaxID=446468 RepID=D7B0G2_NOCDD|nr:MULTISPECIES: NAD+ synthase [Nocardiopsis]ADH66369.1 NAD+ synthetase [Nocardiopsis dassonvillei subsp. dassonvillei DSM 43111]NKY80006.1 NAD+ synthase [Nocardiopsis dassonvillei]VEI92390.1 Glutamine-dependent NAD(+) synthetase [Nocardiopsis dassonvillei]